jgi:predicted transcriptional regulator
MSQDDVIRVLEKYPDGLTYSEIVEKISISPAATFNNLNKLYGWGIVKRKKVDGIHKQSRGIYVYWLAKKDG